MRSSGFVETNRLSKRNADENGGILGISWGDYDILICFLYELNIDGRLMGYCGKWPICFTIPDGDIW